MSSRRLLLLAALGLVVVFAIPTRDDPPPRQFVVVGTESDHTSSRVADSEGESTETGSRTLVPGVHVVDREGRAVVGARLYATDVVDATRWLHSPRLLAESDRRGELGVQPHSHPELICVCMAGGFLPARWCGEDRIVLELGASIAGEVRSLDGGAVAGAVVRASTVSWDPSKSVGVIPGPTPHAVFSTDTDQLGRFRLEGIPSGTYRIRVEHERLVLTDINGEGAAATIAAPSAGNLVRMASIVGRRVEFEGETAISCSWINPRGLRLGGDVLLGAIGRDAVTLGAQKDAFEICGVPSSLGCDMKVVLYALLSRSGPVRLVLPLLPTGDGDYTIRRPATPGSMRTGTVRVTVLDEREREVPLQIALLGVGKIRHLPRRAEDLVDPGDLAWGARCIAGEEALVRAGPYTLSVADPLFGQAPTASIAVEPDSLVEPRLRLETSVVRLLVECDTAGPWRLHIDGTLGDGAVVRKTLWRLPEPRVALWLPVGKYAFRAIKEGYRPLVAERELTDGDASLDLGRFEPN